MSNEQYNQIVVYQSLRYRCVLCDYMAGQLEDVPLYKDKQWHRDFEHNGKIFRWLF